MTYIVVQAVFGALLVLHGYEVWQDLFFEGITLFRRKSFMAQTRGLSFGFLHLRLRRCDLHLTVCLAFCTF